MKKFTLTEKNDSFYFDLFQNERFPNHINPSLSEENFPHFSSSFMRLKHYFLCGFHDGDIITGLGMAGFYKLNKGWAIPYINVHPEYKNKGLATEIFDTLESLCPEKIRISGFTHEGYLYLRPMLLKRGYEVEDKISYWPSNWTWDQIDEWKKNNLYNG